MDDIVLQWASYLKTVKRYSPHTLTAYNQDLRQFLTFLQNYRGAAVTLSMLSELTIKELRAWLSDRLAGGFSPR